MSQFNFVSANIISDAVSQLYAIKPFLDFATYSTKIMKRDVLRCVYLFVSNLLRYVSTKWLSYNNYKKADVYWDTLYWAYLICVVTYIGEGYISCYYKGVGGFVKGGGFGSQGERRNASL